LTEDEWEHLGDLGLLQRTDQQFHWLNRGYETFDDFLNDLTSRKRKNIKKERQGALDSGITIERLTGSDLKEHHWDAFFDFYEDTGSRKWGRSYLTRSFFSLIGETMTDQVMLVMCQRGGHYIAGAINFIGGDTLFGRNWGCIEDHRFLHFEACYYQAIDFAIERGLGRVEAGAQGAHKLARGYVPTRTYSAHYLADARLRDAVERYLIDERQHVDSDIMYLSEHAPFRQDPT
jgi:predicted N-acyltransferase